MSSVERAPAQVPANRLYTNIQGIQSSIFDANLSTISWGTSVTAAGDLSTVGAAVLRDMGKTVYLPTPGGASQSTVLRKIQIVPTGTNGYFGTGGAENDSYLTGYVQIGGQTFGGGIGASRVVRLN
jgi:hypothetical protein